MTHSSGFLRKLTVSIVSGIIVGASATIIDLTIINFDKETLIHQMAGNLMAVLVASLIFLALQLRNEELHYRFAMERAAIIAELNHHVRNAIFPLCVAVQHTGDAEAQRLAGEAVERVNIAMKDAASDVFSMKLEHPPAGRTEAA